MVELLPVCIAVFGLAFLNGKLIGIARSNFDNRFDNFRILGGSVYLVSADWLAGKASRNIIVSLWVSDLNEMTVRIRTFH